MENNEAILNDTCLNTLIVPKHEQVEMITVDVVNSPVHIDLPLPEYETSGSAGMDLRADLSEPYILDPGQIKLISTNLLIKLPKGYELQVRPRSGLAIKHGITVLNSPGTIDSDYTGRIGVILINLGGGPYKINPGDRIAQAVIAKYSIVNWNVVDSLLETERKGGFGSTGIK